MGKWSRLHARNRLAAADMYAAHREILAWRTAGPNMLGVLYSETASAGRSLLQCPHLPRLGGEWRDQSGVDG